MKKAKNEFYFSLKSKSLLFENALILILLTCITPLNGQNCSRVCKPIGKGNTCIILTQCENDSLASSTVADSKDLLISALKHELEMRQRLEEKLIDKIYDSNNKAENKNEPFLSKCWKYFKESLIAQLIVIVLALIFLPTKNWKDRIKLTITLLFSLLPFLKQKNNAQ